MKLFEKFSSILFFGICVEMLVNGAHKKSEGIICYLFPKLIDNRFIKVLDLVIIAGVLSIVGNIMIEPTTDRQGMISGLTLRPLVLAIIEKGKYLKIGGEIDAIKSKGI